MTVWIYLLVRCSSIWIFLYSKKNDSVFGIVQYQEMKFYASQCTIFLISWWRCSDFSDQIKSQMGIGCCCWRSASCSEPWRIVQGTPPPPLSSTKTHFQITTVIRNPICNFTTTRLFYHTDTEPGAELTRSICQRWLRTATKVRAIITIMHPISWCSWHWCWCQVPFGEY